MIAFGVDQQSHAAHFLRDRHATFGGTQEKPSAKSASLHGAIDAETAETVDRDFIAAESQRGVRLAKHITQRSTHGLAGNFEHAFIGHIHVQDNEHRAT